MLRQNVIEALRNLIGAKQRTLLALIGIVIGTGSVIAMVNIGTIVSNEALAQFQKLGTDLIQIGISGETSISVDETHGLADALPELTLTAPIAFGGAAVSYRGRPLSASVVGTTESLANIAKARPDSGRFVNLLDGFATYAVVGDGVRQAIHQQGNAVAVSDRLRIGENAFTVVGTLPPIPFNSLIPMDFNSALIVPIDALARLGGGIQIQTVMARMAPSATAEETAEAIAAWFRAHQPRLTPQVRTAKELIAQMESQMQLYTLLLGAIGSISLIVGGVGVMNVMLVSVTERKQEIGIRMALGARRRDIRQLFVIESIVLSCLGGALGTGLGVGASALFADVQGWSFVLSPVAIPLGAGVSIAVGVFFGFYPAFLAARLNVVDALRAA